MARVTTASGFETEINENALNDMELLDAFMGMDRGDVMQVSVVVNKLIPNKKELYNHVRKEDGTVPIEDVAKEIADIVGSISGTKK